MSVALVTAASRGIGAGIARVLRDKGWDLALMARSEDIFDIARSIDAFAFRGSVADPNDLERFVSTTMEQFGRIDAVVNNTGHPAKGPLLDLDDEDWHAGLDMVLLNVVRMARLVTPIMKEQGSGAFVNITSFATFEPDSRFPISSALRAGTAGFVKLFADQHAADGIRMNNVLPGFIDNQPATEAKLAQTPMKRLGKVEEMGATVAFLLSDEAGFITGQNVGVDGGLTRAI